MISESQIAARKIVQEDKKGKEGQEGKKRQKEARSQNLRAP